MRRTLAVPRAGCSNWISLGRQPSLTLDFRTSARARRIYGMSSDSRRSADDRLTGVYSPAHRAAGRRYRQLSIHPGVVAVAGGCACFAPIGWRIDATARLSRGNSTGLASPAVRSGLPSGVAIDDVCRRPALTARRHPAKPAPPEGEVGCGLLHAARGRRRRTIYGSA